MGLVGVYFRMFQSFPGATLVQLKEKSPCFDAKTGVCSLDLSSKIGDEGWKKCCRLTDGQR